jgi:hypothetical protein
MALSSEDRRKILRLGSAMLLCIASFLAVEIWQGLSATTSNGNKISNVSVKNQLIKRRSKRKLIRPIFKLNTRDLSINNKITNRSRNSVEVKFRLTNTRMSRVIHGEIIGEATYFINKMRTTVRGTSNSFSQTTTFSTRRYVDKKIRFSVPPNARLAKLKIYIKEKRLTVSQK